MRSLVHHWNDVTLKYVFAAYTGVIMKREAKLENSPYLLHSFKRLAGGEVACCHNYEKWNTAHWDYWILQSAEVTHYLQV